MNLLKPYHFTGRNFHCYPHTAKVKDSPTYHNIYRILALYLKDNNYFLYITYFANGEELGAIYYDKGILRIAGLYAENDIKPTIPLIKYNLTKTFQKLAYNKFDKLIKSDDEFIRKLEWRDFVRSSLEEKGLTNKPKQKDSTQPIDESSLTDMFSNL